MIQAVVKETERTKETREREQKPKKKKIARETLVGNIRRVRSRHTFEERSQKL